MLFRIRGHFPEINRAAVGSPSNKAAKLRLGYAQQLARLSPLYRNQHDTLAFPRRIVAPGCDELTVGRDGYAPQRTLPNDLPFFSSCEIPLDERGLTGT